MSFKLKERSSSVESPLVLEAQKICEEWLLNMDEYIKRNLNTLTCDNIREVYFKGLFEELKSQRSNSTGFTGFSEFLIFRVLYHVIGEKFVEVPSHTTTIFKSEKYEIGQGASLPLKFNDYPYTRQRFPDAYVKRNGEMFSIVQIKISLQQGKKGVDKEIETFGDFKRNYPNIKGLFVVLNKEKGKDKEKRLKDAGYQTEVLQGNSKLISEVLKEVV